MLPLKPPVKSLMLAIVWVASLSVAAAQSESEKTRLQVADLYRFDGPQALTLSADGKQAAYVRHWIDPATRQERHSLWLVRGDLDNRQALEQGEPDARSPVFSPDGQWIAIRSTRDHPNSKCVIPPTPAESDAATDLWLIRAVGGEAAPLCRSEKPYGRVFNDTFYGGVAFSPDGRRLAFVADDGRDSRSAAEREANVYVVRPDQGEGYTGYGTAQVWLADLDLQSAQPAARNIRRLTNDDVWYGDPQWSPDGKTLVVHANKTNDRESVRYSINKNYDLWSIDVESGSQRQLTAGPGPEVSPRFSPDGRCLAFLSGPRKGPHADVFNLATLTLASAPKMEIVFAAHDQEPFQFDDPAPLFPLPEECWDGPEALLYNGAAGTKTHTMQLELTTGKRSRLESSDESLDSLTGVQRRLALKKQLTPPGNEFLEDRLRGQTSVVQWKNDADQTIEGVLTLPHASIAQPPCKLLVMPHGGPHSRSTEGFNFNAEVFAAQGYAVFQPNFRGTAGYGRKYLDADRHDFGGGDMRDILSGIDYLVEQKLADPNRQFVYGTSYGGFMTCWLVGHTKQFRAAAAQNAVTDLNMMWGLSDLQSWTQWEFGGLPWEAAEAMKKHSPLTYAAAISTPTLVLHSRDDRRCPLPMGQAFHRALVARNVPTQMVIYPDEGHGIRQPRHREDVLRRVLAWFEQHDLPR